MSLLDDPALWRARADELRRLASAASEELGTRALLEIVAQAYDDLAARAEKRLGSKTDKTQP